MPFSLIFQWTFYYILIWWNNEFTKKALQCSLSLLKDISTNLSRELSWGILHLYTYTHKISVFHITYANGFFFAAKQFHLHFNKNSRTFNFVFLFVCERATTTCLLVACATYMKWEKHLWWKYILCTRWKTELNFLLPRQMFHPLFSRDADVEVCTPCVYFCEKSGKLNGIKKKRKKESYKQIENCLSFN